MHDGRIIFFSILASVEERPKKERLMDVYKYRGDELFLSSTGILIRGRYSAKRYLSAIVGWGLSEIFGVRFLKMRSWHSSKNCELNWIVWRSRNEKKVVGSTPQLATYLFSTHPAGGFQWILDRRGPNFDP
ncbi:hypothetical protein N9224_00050 [Akkermansiaceae bacterium]|nr:hypothetical protein [Akkermansiaceae bacterium]MDB4500555.1 hypothetical protein [Akkermansiaceae bacterium]MDB4507971.1 hypothetical protein [Akkermansiaceae bacterium]MDB4541553.1 hypothetical protein [Akkermansiaceae bacterium]